MLLIRCPYCEQDLPELEFRHAGEAHLARPAAVDEAGDEASDEAGDEEFAAFLYLRDNPKGATYERWRHVHGCGRVFNAVRDTASDRFVTTYKAGAKKPALKGEEA
jgi:sarcosine oxidase subunit delta